MLAASDIFIEADDISYDLNRLITTASGNVHISNNSEAINADMVEYHKQLNKINAYGHVEIRKEDGNTYYADSVSLDVNSDRGETVNFKGKLKNSSITASKATMNSGIIKLKDPTYTACKICESNFISNTPLWQIKAQSGSIDKNNQMMQYENTRVELFNVPVFYTPFISLPIPNAKRKSGFLFPRFKSSKNLGTSVVIPYYWNIASNMDLTFSPRIFTKKEPLLMGEFRHLTEYGKYEFEGSFTYTQKVLKNGTEIKGQKQMRGHYNLASQFSLPNDDYAIYYGLNSKRVYDKSHTFLKKYGIDHEDVLTTNAFAHSFWDDKYLFLDTLHFQDLRFIDSHQTTARALPWLRGRYVKELDFLNSEISLDIDALNLSRKHGVGYQRYSSTFNYNVPFASDNGNLLDVNASIRGDHYDMHSMSAKSDTQGIKTSKRKVSRLYPKFDMRWSIPLIKHTEYGVFILEPMANLVLSKDKVRNDEIFNEDSKFFELSALNLFDSNRFLGHDAIEGGSKVNYGLHGNLKNDAIKSVGFKVGQVLNFKSHSQYGYKSGLSKHKSDYVSNIYIQPTDEIYLMHNLRLRDDNLSIMRNEFYAQVQLTDWRINLNYNETGKDKSEQIVAYRKDLMAGVEYNFYDKWWLGIATRKKFGHKVMGQSKKISDKIDLKYMGDCLHVFFTVERDHTRLNDLKPTTTYLFNFKVPVF